MLKRFEVQGYKNFKNKFILDFSDVRDYQFNTKCIKEGKLNNIIIYGKNAVGKTNFGRAIVDIRNNFIRAFKDFAMDDEIYLNADSNLGYAFFKYVFEIEGNEYIYEYKKKNIATFLEEKLWINQELIFHYNHENKNKIDGNLSLINAQTLNWETLDDNISMLNYLTNNISLTEENLLKKLYDFIKGMRFIRGNDDMMGKNKQKFILNDIIDNNEVKELEKFLNEFGIQEKLQIKTTPTGNKEIYIAHKKPISFIDSMSSGTLSLIQLFHWYKRINKLTFIYIDEFDAFYHYELSEKVIQLLENQENCQSVTTTHNTNLLSNKIMRPDCFFVLTKESITSIVNSTDRELREGHNLEKLYKSGEFDG